MVIFMNYEKIENILKNSDSIVSFKELYELANSKGISYDEVNTIINTLDYLNKIAVSPKGITWIYNTNINLRSQLNNAKEYMVEE